MLDIRAYFPNIQCGILLELLRRQVKGHGTLELCEAILASGEGLYRDPQIRAFLQLGADDAPHGAGLPIGILKSTNTERRSRSASTIH